MKILEFSHNGQHHRFEVETMTEADKELFRTAKAHLYDSVFPTQKKDEQTGYAPSLHPRP